MKDRKQIICDLIRNEEITSQQEIAKKIFEITGEDITQATICRDLKEIGAVKVFDNNKVKYAIQTLGEFDRVEMETKIDSIINQLEMLKKEICK